LVKYHFALEDMKQNESQEQKAIEAQKISNEELQLHKVTIITTPFISFQHKTTDRGLTSQIYTTVFETRHCIKFFFRLDTQT